jgi:deoxyribodipyrimidine photo-lyase
MQRTQRGRDNHALDVAIREANARRLPVIVYFAPVPFYPYANLRHYAFLQRGISDIARDVSARNGTFVLRRYPDHSLAKLIAEVDPALLISDENPLREPEHWRQVVAKRVKLPFWTVDADVVVPSSFLTKEMYAAHHLRTRFAPLLEQFITPFENVSAGTKWSGTQPSSISLDSDITAGWEIDRSVPPSEALSGGTSEALRLLDDFVTRKLKRYSIDRNHPEIDGTSRLSPYLHFGHIGPVTIALVVQSAKAPEKEKDAFLDELITWRELAINFAKYNSHYDSIENADAWARKSLGEHAGDSRAHVYTASQLERAETHDDLWNAAHTQMIRDGWMHNYMRMYWAKKILEWSKSPAHAYNTAVRLNDKYELDGRDPNGYAGIAWAITGKHDRAWFDRPVFGKIRYMSANAAAKKFDTKRYIQQQLRAASLF